MTFCFTFFKKSEVTHSDNATSPSGGATKRKKNTTGNGSDSGFEESHEELVKEVKTLRRQAIEHEKTGAALKLACAVSIKFYLFILFMIAYNVLIKLHHWAHYI